METQDRFTFNAYDLFSNFLPGVVLLSGLWLPFAHLSEPLPKLTFVQAAMAAILAFGLGVGTQSLGSIASRRQVFGTWPWNKRERPFNRKMNRMLCADERPESVTSVDWAARQMCTEVFNLDCDGNDDCSYVFKSLIAYLEGSNWNRSIRIQALHLSSRSLYIVCLLLFLYYVAFAVGLSISANVTPVSYDGIFDPVSLSIVSVSLLPLSWIFFRRARHFESDVAKYMLSEFYLSCYDWNEFEIESLLETRPEATPDDD